MITCFFNISLYDKQITQSFFYINNLHVMQSNNQIN